MLFTTFDNADDAAKAVRTLVEERLAACGTSLPGARSIYRWKDTVDDTGESVVLRKTSVQAVAELEKRLRAIHPYEVPEIVVVDPVAVSAEYASWVHECCGVGPDEPGSHRFGRATDLLDEILVDVRAELDAARAKRPPAQIRRMIPDAPAIRPLHGSLAGLFRLIAEIKERSPSVGPMRRENVAEAARSYEESPIVAAVSVLTNSVHFGMSIERLREIRKAGSKPVLRKDFIVEEYQIREARAFGSDSILLMANVLDRSRLRGFYDLARELGMEALFEVHTKEEISRWQIYSRIIDINSTKLRAKTENVGAGEHTKRFQPDYAAFDPAESLPAGTHRVARAADAGRVRRCGEHFDAALVGIVLRDPRGAGVSRGIELALVGRPCPARFLFSSNRREGCAIAK